MPLTISDEILREAGLTEREGLIEFACRLFEAGRLALWPAAKLAGLSRTSFQQELAGRHIALYRPTTSDIEDDVVALQRLEN